jgi:hypothetical protein
MLPGWLALAAAEFWETTSGRPASRPIDLEPIALRALPLTVTRLARLEPAVLISWLEDASSPASAPLTRGRLHGALVVRWGYGHIFLDACDPPDEQRFSFAHELAHFLLHFRRLQERACQLLGPAIAAVLAGERPPTDQERLLAALSGLSLVPSVDLFEYDELDSYDEEDAVDRLALELLAPAEEALVLAGEMEGMPPSQRLSELTARLSYQFGLPSGLARQYARRLLATLGLDPPADWLLVLPSPRH